MKKKTAYKYEILIPIIAAGLFFFTRKVPLPNIYYSILILLAGVWYFPVRVFYKSVFKGENLNGKIAKTVASIILSAIMFLSVFLLFNPGHIFVKTTFQLLAIVNVFFLYYFHFKNKDAQLFFIHLAFMFFTPVVFV
jgi:O-antigen/teichoic acid export membrane protein